MCIKPRNGLSYGWLLITQLLRIGFWSISYVYLHGVFAMAEYDNLYAIVCLKWTLLIFSTVFPILLLIDFSSIVSFILKAFLLC